jgi:hypothetical protein
MNWDEYNILFHKLNLNRVAFKEVINCSEEILTLVNAAIDAAAQEKRQWVGLTDEEFFKCSYDADEREDAMRAVEAKLKEKNT